MSCESFTASGKTDIKDNGVKVDLSAISKGRERRESSVLDLNDTKVGF